MNDMAKVTWSAAGQSVELPEGYRFEGDAVRISREGDRIVLAPLDPVGDASIDDEGTDSETGLPVAELRRLNENAEPLLPGTTLDIPHSG